MGVKMAPISGSFWPSWRVGMSLWSGGACFSLPLLHLNSAMGRERSDGKLKLAPPARHVGFFRSRSIKIGLILTPMSVGAACLESRRLRRESAALEVFLQQRQVRVDFAGQFAFHARGAKQIAQSGEESAHAQAPSDSSLSTS